MTTRWSKKYSVDKSEAVQGATGSTALHVACANGCIKIVDLLLRNNARVDVKDKYGSTPLDIAYAKNEMDIVKLLTSAQKRQGNHDNASIKSKTRRPSLPSILEHKQQHHPPILHNIHSLMSMTPTTNYSNPTTQAETPTRRQSLSAHRPPAEVMHTHSCPTTPRTSTDSHNRHNAYEKFRRTSEDTHQSINLSSSLQSRVLDISNQRDYYGYGVINSYDDDNYLLSLERRAYNLSFNDDGELERHPQEPKGGYPYISHRRHISGGSFTTSCTTVSEEDCYHSIDSRSSKQIKSENEIVPNMDETGYEGELDEEEDSTSNESTPRRSSVALDSETDVLDYMKSQALTKKKWFNDMTQSVENITRRSLDLRPNFENLAQFARRGVPHMKSNDEDSTEDDEQQHKGFFSKISPLWSRKQV